MVTILVEPFQNFKEFQILEKKYKNDYVEVGHRIVIVTKYIKQIDGHVEYSA